LVKTILTPRFFRSLLNSSTNGIVNKVKNKLMYTNISRMSVRESKELATSKIEP
jgi:hypothetical protein